MIVTVGNTKGGVGKTTISLNVAIGRMLGGRKVWLVDGDRQGTAQTALSIRAESGAVAGIPCANYHDGSTLKSQVRLQAQHYDDVVIDAGGRDSSALRAALVVSDVVLIPVQPRSFDVWALADIAALVGDAQSINERLRALVVVSCADASHHGDNSATAEAVADYPNLTPIPALISRRKSFANAGGDGLSVFENRPRDAKACAEMQHVIDLIFGA